MLQHLHNTRDSYLTLGLHFCDDCCSFTVHNFTASCKMFSLGISHFNIFNDTNYVNITVEYWITNYFIIYRSDVFQPTFEKSQLIITWTMYFKADALAILGPPFCIPAYAISNATLFFQMLFRNLHSQFIFSYNFKYC